MRLAYMGTAGFAVPALEALSQTRHEITAVYTQPPRPAGRGMAPRLSPVATCATALKLPLHTPVSLKEADEHRAFQELGVDLAVVAAYGLILPKAILETPRLGCINLHGSRLPRWRGAAPIQRAMLAGDQETGITIIQMDKGLDTGPMLAMESLMIDRSTSAGELHDRLADLAARMVVPLVDRLMDGPISATPQPETGALYARKIDKSEGELDWRQPAEVIECKIRAFNPWPGCWTVLDGQRLRISGGTVVNLPGSDAEPGTVLDDRLLIACGTNGYRITEIQRAGGKTMPAEVFLRGYPLSAGAQLGSPCPATN